MSSIGTSLGDIGQDDFWDAAPLEPHLLYQGEVLVDMPLLSMAKETRWLWVETRSGRPIDVALKQGGIGGQVYVHDSKQTEIKWAECPEGVFAIGRLSKLPVLILSQTCDIQSKTFIQVAPIFPIPPGDEDYVQRVKRGELFSVFPLQEHAPELAQDSYADFELIQAVHKGYLKRPDPDKHFRLGQAQILKLQQAVTRYFGRPNAFDAGTDKAPRTGTYLCIRCFYSHGRVTNLNLEKGQEFAICPNCKETKWVPHLKPH